MGKFSHGHMVTTGSMSRRSGRMMWREDEELADWMSGKNVGEQTNVRDEELQNHPKDCLREK